MFCRQLSVFQHDRQLVTISNMSYIYIRKKHMPEIAIIFHNPPKIELSCSTHYPSIFFSSTLKRETETDLIPSRLKNNNYEISGSSESTLLPVSSIIKLLQQNHAPQFVAAFCFQLVEINSRSLGIRFPDILMRAGSEMM